MLQSNETATINVEVSDNKEALIAVRKIGGSTAISDASFKSTLQLTFTKDNERYEILVKGVDDTITDGKKTTAIKLSVDKAAVGLPSELKTAKDKLVTVITLDDDVTSKETPPEPVRTGSFNVIVGQSLGLADIGIDSNNLKGLSKKRSKDKSKPSCLSSCAVCRPSCQGTNYLRMAQLTRLRSPPMIRVCNSSSRLTICSIKASSPRST